MELRASNGMGFVLKVLGYEFPELTTGLYDSNWLHVHIDVTHPKGNWSAEFPCLLTFEAGGLADWFDNLADGNNEDTTFGFFEPHLRFFLIGLSTRPDMHVLRVYLLNQFEPPWDESDQTEPAWVEFPRSEIDFRAAASALRAQIKEFPQRAEH